MVPLQVLTVVCVELREAVVRDGLVKDLNEERETSFREYPPIASQGYHKGIRAT